MRTALAFCECRQRTSLFGGLVAFLTRITRIPRSPRIIIFKNNPPSRLQHFATGHFKIDLTRLSQYRRVAYLAFGIENSDVMERHEVIYLLLIGRQSFRTLTGRNDRMVVRNFLVIKYFLGFRQFSSQQRRNRREIILDTRQRSRYFRIQVVTQIGGIHTRISRHALLIQRLNELERLLRRETEFLVAIDLQRSQVIQLGRILKPFLLLHRSNGQRQIFDTIHQCLSLFLRSDGPPSV